MDILHIERLKLKTRIGEYAWEQAIQRTVFFDLELPIDVKKASFNDNLADAINYEILYHQLEQLLTSTSFRLIETLAEQSAALLLKTLQISWIKLKVSKPYAISQVSAVSVSITRYAEPKVEPVTSD